MALASFYAQTPMLYGIYTPAMAPPPPWQPARNKRKQELKYNDDLGFHVETEEVFAVGTLSLR